MARNAALNTRGKPGVRRHLGIRVAHLRPLKPEWCWRDDWVQGGESIYGLLALFEALNAIGGPQLREDFVDAVGATQGSTLHAPIVDLRSTERMRLAKLSSVLRLPIEQVRAGFVADAFPRSGWQGHTALRWCPQCATSGYHSTLFQVPVVFSCAAHGCAIQGRCPRCRSDLPYRLDTSVSTPLFCCPACRLDLAPAIRVGQRKALPDRHIWLLTARFELMQFCDSLPTVAAAVLGAGTSRASELLYSAPGQAVRPGEFKSFMTRVLVSLKASPQGDLHRIEPSYTFFEPTASSAGRRRGARPSTVVASGWPERLVPRSDKRLQRATTLYRCVRRHLWRRLVKQHRRCILSMCRHLWWAVDGSETVGLCVVAAAFVRWRLRWEAVRQPTALLSVPAAPPLGLVTWLALAPIGPPAWTSVIDGWLIDHVLGHELLASFDAMLDEERSSPRTSATKWGSNGSAAWRGQCWVCSGRGTSSSPAQLFFPVDCVSEASEAPPKGKRHTTEHLKLLGNIEH
jgi:hypothetical protein